MLRVTESCHKNVLTFILSVLKRILRNDPINLRFFKALLWMLRNVQGIQTALEGAGVGWQSIVNMAEVMIQFRR